MLAGCIISVAAFDQAAGATNLECPKNTARYKVEVQERKRGKLPFTGSGTLPLAIVGGMFLLAGAGLMMGDCAGLAERRSKLASVRRA